MCKLGIPKKLVRMTKVTMRCVRRAVKVEGEVSQEFEILGGLKQGDGLSCAPFIIALAKAMRTAGIADRGTILNRSIQILGYADDVDIIRRSIVEVREAFFKIQEAAENLGLRVNEDKTKLLVASAPDNRRVIAANRCYYGLSKQLWSGVLSSKTKCNIYKTLI